MRRWFTIAALTATLLATPAWAQMRGMARPAGPGFATRAPIAAPTFRSGPAMTFHRGPGFAAGFPHGSHGRVFVGQPFFHHHHRRFFSPTFPFGFFGGFYAAPAFYDSSMYSYGSYDYANDPYYQQTQQLQQEVNRLGNEVQQLREQQAEVLSRPTIREAPVPPESAKEAKPSPPIVTTLIFRDGHKQTIGNYAIVGPTLWILDEQQAKKIPLAQLDIPATRKTNEDHGVDFGLPARVVCGTPQECTVQWR